MDLLTKMYHYCNTIDSDNTYYRIIHYCLSNLEKLPALSISELAEQTYVSTATITRFIHFLELENYAAFRQYFSEVTQKTSFSFLKMKSEQVQSLVEDPAQFLQTYTEQIILGLRDVMKTLDVEQIDSLIKRILQTKQVAFLGYNDSAAITRDIQIGCLMRKKVVEVAENNEKIQDIIDRFDTNSLIIILSNYGNFFSHYNDYYHQMLAKRIPIVLVTQNYNSMDSFQFADTIYLSSYRQLTIGNYPMRIFSDYFVRRMIHLSL